jgi:hypothetical protein
MIDFVGSEVGVDIYIRCEDFDGINSFISTSSSNSC